MNSLQWLSEHCRDEPQEIVKQTQATRAWFAILEAHQSFIKWYPAELCESWAKTETVIAGANLHPAIVPLRQTIKCDDGVLLIYDRVNGADGHPAKEATSSSKIKMR